VETKTNDLSAVLSDHFFVDLLNIPSEARDWLSDVKEDDQLTNDDGTPTSEEYLALLKAFTSASAPNRIDEHTFNIVLDGTRYYITVQTEEAYGATIDNAALGEDQQALEAAAIDPLAYRRTIIDEYVGESLHGGDEPTVDDFIAYCDGADYGDTLAWALETDHEELAKHIAEGVERYNSEVHDAQLARGFNVEL